MQSYSAACGPSRNRFVRQPLCEATAQHAGLYDTGTCQPQRIAPAERAGLRETVSVRPPQCEATAQNAGLLLDDHHPRGPHAPLGLSVAAKSWTDRNSCEFRYD